MRERESVSSSLSLSASSSPSSFSSLIPTSPLPPHLVDVLLRRVRAQHGVEGELDFFFFFGGLKERESVVGTGREAATLPLCSLIPSISRFTIIFLFSFPIECRTWLSPEPSPRSTTTRLFCRGVWICKKKGASERQKGKRLRFVLKEA